MINVMVRACLTPEIKDISNLIELKIKKNHVRDRNLTEDRIYPKAELDRMPNDVPKLRSVD